MVRGVRGLSLDETPGPRPLDRCAGRNSCSGYGGNEVCAVRARPFFRLGVARAWLVDYDGFVDRPPANPAAGRRTNWPGKKLMKATCCLVLGILLILSVFSFAADSPFDLVITNGHIVDGTGCPLYSGDIGIRDGRIAAIGNLSAAARKRTVDAR